MSVSQLRPSARCFLEGLCTSNAVSSSCSPSSGSSKLNSVFSPLSETLSQMIALPSGEHQTLPLCLHRHHPQAHHELGVQRGRGAPHLRGQGRKCHVTQAPEIKHTAVLCIRADMALSQNGLSRSQFNFDNYRATKCVLQPTAACVPVCAVSLARTA